MQSIIQKHNLSKQSFIVVNKPAGLVVHPAAGVTSGTLANALAYHFQHLSQTSGRARPGIVHRLDRDTSGLMVVAKNETAHENLQEQFRTRAVFKSYVALVHGRVKEEEQKGRVEQPIGRDPSHRTRMAVVRNGRPAYQFFFRVVLMFDDPFKKEHVQRELPQVYDALATELHQLMNRKLIEQKGFDEPLIRQRLEKAVKTRIGADQIYRVSIRSMERMDLK